MINELINNHGGPHNRVKKYIKIEPLSLHEPEGYLIFRGHKCTRYKIIHYHIATRGIPYYLEGLDPKLSILQNIDDMCFHKGSLLRT